MNDLPQDIPKTAGEVLTVYGIKSTPANTFPLARALLAERERCATYIERQQSLIMDRQEIARDIRNGVSLDAYGVPRTRQITASP